MKATTLHHVRIGSRRVDYRVVLSRAAKKLRVRVGPDGVEVIQPRERENKDVVDFVAANAGWIVAQLNRAEGLRGVRLTIRQPTGQIYYRGEPTPVRVELTSSQSRGNAVARHNGELVVSRGPRSKTEVARSLELWLRREARRNIESHLDAVTKRLGRRPTRVFVRAQRTKWGNCSTQGNLSFNWRLILAPDYVLRYLVTHEAVHLAIPDHSAKFWLTVQSLCRETERAKQWLCRHQAQMQVDLAALF